MNISKISFRGILWILPLFFLAIFLVGMGNRPAGEIKIGVVLPLTGRAATYGERSLNGFMLAVDHVNSGMQHNPIKLVVEDSQSQASRAVTSFTKLVNINKVPVIVGLLTSDEALACAPLAIKYKVVLFTPGATSEKLKEAGTYVFRNRESVELQTSVIAKACVERTGGGKIAILHANAANAISYRDTFMAASEALGANVVGTVPFNEGKMDYRSELEQLRALSPVSVYLAGYDSELGLILKQAREVGLEANFFASAGAVTPKLLEIAREGAEGLIAASASFDPQSTAPHVRNFVDTYTTQFDNEPDWLAANSYDAIQMLAQIAEKNKFDSKQIRESLIGMKDFPGVAGTTTFDSNGGVQKVIQLVEVRENRFVPLQ